MAQAIGSARPSSPHTTHDGTTAPHPDDFDAITGTRDSTTVYDDAANSALDTDYNDITVPRIFTLLWSDCTQHRLST